MQWAGLRNYLIEENSFLEDQINDLRKFLFFFYKEIDKYLVPSINVNYFLSEQVRILI